jgi:hypothetical protein
LVENEALRHQVLQVLFEASMARLAFLVLSPPKSLCCGLFQHYGMQNLQIDEA